MAKGTRTPEDIDSHTPSSRMKKLTQPIIQPATNNIQRVNDEIGKQIQKNKLTSSAGDEILEAIEDGIINAETALQILANNRFCKDLVDKQL